MLRRRSPPLPRAFPAGACRVCVASRHHQPFAANRLGRAPSLWSALRCQSSSQDYYSLLGVSSGASKSDIDTAYQRLAADAEGKLKQQLLSDAHAVLSNELKRKEYDAMCQKSDARSLTVISDDKSAKANPQNSTNATNAKNAAEDGEIPFMFSAVFIYVILHLLYYDPLMAIALLLAVFPCSKFRSGGT